MDVGCAYWCCKAILVGPNNNAKTKAVRILIVDDHPIIHKAIAAILSEMAECQVLSAFSAEDGLGEFIRRCPDAAIIDDTLPVASGYELLSDILSHNAEAKVIMFADDGRAASASRALEIGARAFLGKSEEPQLLKQAVRSVYSGKVWLTERLKQEIALMRLTGKDADKDSSARELAILSKLSRGDSLGEIGHDLGLSYKTITNEVANLRRKLGARTQPEMVRIAMEKGLLG